MGAREGGRKVWRGGGGVMCFLTIPIYDNSHLLAPAIAYMGKKRGALESL